MNKRDDLRKAIESLTKEDFEAIALEVYDYQFAHNPLYKRYVQLLKGASDFRPKSILEVPFLPISFFKSHTIKSDSWKEECVYKSSATTGMVRSRHLVRDNGWYLSQAQKAYEQKYGSLIDQVFLALLPGYLERGDSSLVAMAAYFIEKTDHEQSGFYLHDFDALSLAIKEARQSGRTIVLLGVSFALFQLAEKDLDLSDIIVMETGGMKGIGPDMPKPAFHEHLKAGFKIKQVHSEYGMTELLSQAYSSGDGIFEPADLMKVYISELTDPLSWMPNGRGGVINIVDLANVDTCAFIQTEDMGIRDADGNFRLLGRVDAAEIRGCNLLVTDIGI